MQCNHRTPACKTKFFEQHATMLTDCYEMESKKKQKKINHFLNNQALSLWANCTDVPISYICLAIVNIIGSYVFSHNGNKQRTS